MDTAARATKNLSGQKMGAKGRATRHKIIEVTVELLGQMRLHDLKVVDIAQEAAMSAGTFYLYFDSVIDVVLAAVAETTQSGEDLIALIEAPWDPAPRSGSAYRLVHLYVENWDEHRALFRTRNLAAEEGDERFLVARENATRGLVAALAARIEATQEACDYEPVAQPAAIAGTLTMMLERLGALSHIYRVRSGRIPYEELVLAAADALNRAISPPPGR